MRQPKFRPMTLRWVLLVLGVLLLTGSLSKPMPSTTSASTLDTIKNQRPRFKIPRGTLSYYRNPQWEILYFLKFGTFPVYTSSAPYLNQTEYLAKLRQIKKVLDESSRESNLNLIRALESTSDEHFPMELDLRDSPFAQGLQPNQKKKLIHEVVTEVYHNSERHQRPMHFGKKRSQETMTEDQPPGSADGYRSMRKARVYDYDSLDGSQEFIRNRVPKQVTGDMDLISESMMSGSAGDGGMIGGFGAEMSIDPKTNRKFQTQGWK